MNKIGKNKWTFSEKNNKIFNALQKNDGRNLWEKVRDLNISYSTILRTNKKIKNSKNLIISHGNLHNKNALKYSNEQINHQIENIKAISKKIYKNHEYSRKNLTIKGAYKFFKDLIEHAFRKRAIARGYVTEHSAKSTRKIVRNNARAIANNTNNQISK